MSAFIVDDSTINRIVTYFYADRYATKERQELVALGLTTKPDDLGEEMYRMNLAAVEDRYGDYAAGTMGAIAGPDYHYQPETGSLVQVLKSLRCYLYQCSQGNIPKLPLFQLLERYSGDLALNIVRQMPEYDAALWG